MKKKKINKMYPFCTHIFVNTLEMIEYPLLNEKKEAKINHRPCMQNNINNK